MLIDAVTAACARVTDAFGQRSAARAAERAALPEGQVAPAWLSVRCSGPCTTLWRASTSTASATALAPPSHQLGPQVTPWYSAVVQRVSAFGLRSTCTLRRSKPRSIGDVVFACCRGMPSGCVASARQCYSTVQCGAQALAEPAPEVRVYLDEESVLHHRLARIAARFAECAELALCAQPNKNPTSARTAVADPT